MQLLNAKFANFVKEEIKHELKSRKNKAPQELPQISIKLTSAGVNRETNVAFDIEVFADYLDALRTRWSS